MPKPLSTTVTAIVGAPADVAFDHIVPIDLRVIFKGYRMIPGVAHTSVVEGWNKAGLTRTVTLADGSSSTETLLTVVPHSAFSYRNEHFTSPVLRFLMSRFEGRWKFTPVESASTHIEWTYTLFPGNRLASGIIRLVVLGMFHGMLREALKIIKDRLDMPETQGTGSAS